jgi:hypothetical protein
MSWGMYAVIVYKTIVNTLFNNDLFKKRPFFLRMKGVIKADEFQIASLQWQIDDSVCKHRDVI